MKTDIFQNKRDMYVKKKYKKETASELVPRNQ